MKNIIKIFALFLAAVVVFTACEKQDLIYSGKSFVAFKGTSVTVVESAVGTFEIVVELAAPIQTAAVTLDYAIDAASTATEGVDFSIVGDSRQLTFAPGTFTDTIRFTVADNLEEDGLKNVILMLTGVSGDINLGYPGPKSEAGEKADFVAAKKQFTININDDDCALVAANFTGAPSGLDAAWGASSYGNKTTWTLKTDQGNGVLDFEVDGMFKTIIDEVWGEVVTSGETKAVLRLDNSNPLAPTISIVTPFNFITDGRWGYELIDCQEPANVYYPERPITATFSTCGHTIDYWYGVNIQDGGADAAIGWGWLILEFTGKKVTITNQISTNASSYTNNQLDK